LGIPQDAAGPTGGPEWENDHAPIPATSLGGVIAQHIDAVNAFDVDAIVATFAPMRSSTTPA